MITADLIAVSQQQQDRAKRLTDELSAVTITDQESLELASQALRVVKQIKNETENARKKITGPLHEAWKAACAHFKPAVDLFDTCERQLKSKIGEYEREQRLLRLAQANATPDTRAIVSAPVDMPAGITVKTVQKWDIVDPDAVPREYCSPDRAKIQAALSAGAVVPGVQFSEAEIVRVRK